MQGNTDWDPGAEGEPSTPTGAEGPDIVPPGEIDTSLDLSIDEIYTNTAIPELESLIIGAEKEETRLKAIELAAELAGKKGTKGAGAASPGVTINLNPGFSGRIKDTLGEIVQAEIVETNPLPHVERIEEDTHERVEERPPEGQSRDLCKGPSRGPKRGSKRGPK